jgi:hypothetical protein
MNPIEQDAIQRFQTNLQYLKKDHPEIYKKIDILTLAIENGSYKERYSLEYKETYFDVLEIDSNTYLYNQDSNQHAKNLAKKIDYLKSNGVIESFYKQNITKKQAEYYAGNVPIDGPLYAAAEIIHYANSLAQENEEMKTIDKFVFAGVGLGVHLLHIQKKINASYLFIAEDNLELFRLSLFVIPYNILAKTAELFFSIMDNEIEFRHSFEPFFVKAYNYNHYIKYATLFNNKHIKQIQSYIVSAQYISFPYSSQLKELLKAPEYLIQKYPFLNLSSIHKNKFLDNKPMLLIASGPSLQNNLSWLKENRDKFVVIAVLSSLKTLYKENIKPDIIINIDASIRSPRLLEGIDVENFLDNTLVLLSSVVTRALIDSFKEENVYCFETASDYKIDFGTITAPSVGETAYAISLLIGTKKLYLLGLDLALDPETHLTHAQEHHDSRQISVEKNIEEEYYTQLNETAIEIKGNFLSKVTTLPVYQISIAAFNAFSKHLLKQEQSIFNLNNGAYLEGTTPLQIDSIDTKTLNQLNHKKIFSELKSFFDKISENSLNKKDIQNLEEQLEEAYQLRAYMKEFSNTVSTNNFETYMKAFYQLSSKMINISSEKKYDINMIFYVYLLYITGYIFNIFNTKNLKNTKRHLKKINLLFVNGVLKILNIYIGTMEVYLKFAKA